MKHFCFLAPATLLAASIQGQGTINFDNNVPGVLRAPLYGAEVDAGCTDIAKTGNTATGIPAGVQMYSGPLLSGTGYSASLFGGPLGSAPESMILLGTTTFLTGVGAGFVVPQVVSLPGLAAGQRASFQVRAWDNQNGTITSWAAAMASGTTLFGESDVFSPPGMLGGSSATAMELIGLTSFNIHTLDDGSVCVPEPSQWAIIGLAGGVVAGARLFSRRRA